MTAPPTRPRTLLALAAVAVAFAAADTYVVVLALPEMMAAVGVPIDQLQKAAPIVSGFLLGYVAMLPLIGRIADLRGRVPVLVAALVVFAARLPGDRARLRHAHDGGRPVPPGRRRRRAGARDPRARRRPLPRRTTRSAARRGLRGPGDRQRAGPALRCRRAVRGRLAGHLRGEPGRRPGPGGRHPPPGRRPRRPPRTGRFDWPGALLLLVTLVAGALVFVRPPPLLRDLPGARPSSRSPATAAG